jgi:hypothetical protein
MARTSAAVDLSTGRRAWLDDAMLPPLRQFFADAAWCHMAAFLQKSGGEGRGEGPF